MLPFLRPPVVAMVKLQRLTGMRPGEVVLMRPCDLDISGAVWIYRPSRHKTKWRGKDRTVCLGPQVQAMLKPFLESIPPSRKRGNGKAGVAPDLFLLVASEATVYLFSPARDREMQAKERRSNRKTPLWPSHVAHQNRKRKRRPLRLPRERYDVVSYRCAIFRACDRAFLPPKPISQCDDETFAEWMERLTPAQKKALAKWQSDNRWHPNQLRHLHATEIRKQFGLGSGAGCVGA